MLLHPGIHARATPDKPAYIMAGSGQAISYRELERESMRWARLFRDAGLRPGDGIAIHAENHPRYLQICWGAQRSGLYYTCIATHLTADEVAYIVDDCGARLFIGTAARAEVAAELPGRMPRVGRRLMLGAPVAGYEELDAALAPYPAAPPDDECEGSDLLYSSGTTGRPKGIKREAGHAPYGTPPASLARLQAAYGFGEETVYLSPAPLYHAAPLRFNMAVTRLGGTSIVMEKFDAARALALIERYRVTHSQWVPTMFIRMLELPAAARRRLDLTSMRCAIHAAAPCPVPVKRRMIDWWGKIIHEYYGGTESNGITMLDSEQWLAHPGSVGRAVVGVVKIVGGDGEALPPGEIGVIHFAGGRPFEYLNDPEGTARSRHRAGWTTLGDIGYVDDDGYLYLTDREDHMIISGGVNIYPQESESLLLAHPKVADAAVIGVPHPELGEEVKAVVRPLPGAEGPGLEEELIAYCRDRLSHVKCPRSVDLVAELPREENGKLYKGRLRDRYWAGHGSKIV